MDASPTQPSQANLCNVGMLAKMNTMIVIMSTKMAVQRECTVMALKATDVPIKPDPTQAVMTVISLSMCHPTNGVLKLHLHSQYATPKTSRPIGPAKTYPTSDKLSVKAHKKKRLAEDIQTSVGKGSQHSGCLILNTPIIQSLQVVMAAVARIMITPGTNRTRRKRFVNLL